MWIDWGPTKVQVDPDIAEWWEEYKFQDTKKPRKGFIATNGYPVFGKHQTHLHHIVVGHPPKGFMVDHINQDKLDNRRENLRITTRAVNAVNSDKYRGVYQKNKKFWSSFRRKYLGMFDTPEEARAAYDEARQQYLEAHT